MLDIELIRKDRASVEAALSKRLEPSEVSRALSAIAELDKQRRELIGDIDAERARRKEEARAFGAAKAAGQAIEPPPATRRPRCRSSRTGSPRCRSSSTPR